MDLSVRYLGLRLAHPFMPGSSPLADDIDMVRRLEDAGASAIVLRSLFEEQIVSEELATHEAMHAAADLSAEASSYFPQAADYSFGPHDYLEHLHRVRAAVKVPVLASLNGVRLERCLDYARQIEQAGASALELNLYAVPIDPAAMGSFLEDQAVATVQAMKCALGIPVAVKLSPFWTSLPNFAARLAEAGADGLVIFNRFYQPDIDVDSLEMKREIQLSTSADLLLRLRWLAILHERVPYPLAVTGGVHTPNDAVKALMAGASAVQLVSAIFKQGPGVIRRMKHEVGLWLEEHEYESLEQLVGSMDLHRTPDPTAYERANYIHVLRSWKRCLG